MAVLDDSLPTQMDEAGAQLDDVEIAFKGERPDAFLSACRETRPHVIVVNVDLFESEPDPARVVWRLLPGGDVGITNPRNATTGVCEEGHIIREEAARSRGHNNSRSPES